MELETNEILGLILASWTTLGVVGAKLYIHVNRECKELDKMFKEGIKREESNNE